MISKRDSSEILKFGRCKITKSLGKDKVSFPFFGPYARMCASENFIGQQ